MADDFGQYLADLADRDDLHPDHLALVQATQEQWSNGVVPGSKTLQLLGRMTRPSSPTPCGRLQLDGSCGWVRKYGKGYDLPVPPQGEKAMCLFGANMPNCPGYKRSR